MTEPNPEPSTKGEKPSRRNALLWMTGSTGVAAAGALGVPLVGFFAGAVSVHSVSWVTLGPISKFPLNETRLETFDNPYREPWDGASGKAGAYVRYLGKDSTGNEQFWIFAMNCTHLGCPVSWFPQSGLFMCPCHGGVYYENGDRASGPPPRGLYKMPWRITNGNLEVQAPHLPTLQDTLEKPSRFVQLGLIKRDMA